MAISSENNKNGGDGSARPPGEKNGSDGNRGYGADSGLDDPAIRNVEERLKRAKTQHRPEERQDRAGLGAGFRLSSEFIAGIVVGSFVGWLLDRWLETSPWLFLVCALLGFGAGVLNVVRAVAEMNREAAERDRDKND